MLKNIKFAFFSNFFGILLILIFGTLFFGILYSYYFDICFLYHIKFKNLYLTLFMILFALLLSALIFFNYTLSCFVDPGYLDGSSVPETPHTIT